MWKTLKEQFDSPDAFVSLALGLAVVLVVGMVAYNYFKTKSEVATNDQKAKEEKMVALPTKHTVKEGETLWSIAEAYFKSGYNWVDIAKANNLVSADFVEAGTVLTVPDAQPIPAPAGETSSASVDTTMQKKNYTVVGGDSLWTISEKAYGTGYKWAEIATANNLTDPNVIHPGNVLMLP